MNINFLDTTITNELKARYTEKSLLTMLANVDFPDNENGYKLLSLGDTETIKRALAYYINASQKKDFKKIKNDCPFKLVSNFIGKKDVRYFLNYIYSNGEELIGSNGHVLIKVKHAIDSGFYTKEKVKIDMDTKYPNFDKVFNQPLTTEIDIDSGIKFQIDLKITAIGYSTEGKQLNFDVKYIELLKRLGIKKIQLFSGGVSGLYFKSDNNSIEFDGVIMGLNDRKK
jgi:hypothetical protein